MAKEVKFERLDDGSWDMIKDDPDDLEYEVVVNLDEDKGFSKIEDMKTKGWKVRPVDSSFNGFVLYKEKIKFPKEWRNFPP